MTTVKGLFAAGDASGASSHKFSSGSHAEGRIAAKGAALYCVENTDQPKVDMAVVDKLKEVILKPLDLFEEHKNFSTDDTVNPYYIRPDQFMFRLQKIMDEYAGGVSTNFTTSKQLLEKGLELLGLLAEDAPSLGAPDLHELMRCWENVHRMWQAESHVRTILFREETRWPGYYYRSDLPTMNEDWECFANCKWDRTSGEWEMLKRPMHRVY